MKTIPSENNMAVKDRIRVMVRTMTSVDRRQARVADLLLKAGGTAMDIQALLIQLQAAEIKRLKKEHVTS